MAGACLRDSGWLVCLASLSGNRFGLLLFKFKENLCKLVLFLMHDFFFEGSALTWLEKYVSRLDLEIVRRFVIENEIYSREIEVDRIVTQVN